MFTLNFPIQLPRAHTYFSHSPFPIPALPGGHEFQCVDNEVDDQNVVVLKVLGFASEQAAKDYIPILRSALRIATLNTPHSILPSAADASRSDSKHFNGAIPTITPTVNDALPYHAHVNSRHGTHLSVLSKLLGAAIAKNLPAKLNANPELALALELHADVEFVGGKNAQFIMSLTALEVLIPKQGSKGKRSAVVSLVKKYLGKAAGKSLDNLYSARNDLVHDGAPISDGQVAELKEIVRSTLNAVLVS